MAVNCSIARDRQLQRLSPKALWFRVTVHVWLSVERRLFVCRTLDDRIFSISCCVQLIAVCAAAEKSDVIGPEGMEKFCEDIGVEPENVCRRLRLLL